MKRVECVPAPFGSIQYWLDLCPVFKSSYGGLEDFVGVRAFGPDERGGSVRFIRR